MSKYLFQDKSRFKFLEKVCSINQDGEKYVSISVLSLDNKKFNFISHDDSVIQTIQSLNIENLSDIIVNVGFYKSFNPRTRFSNWQCDLLGVEV